MLEKDELAGSVKLVWCFADAGCLLETNGTSEACYYYYGAVVSSLTNFCRLHADGESRIIWES
jgi:hypothetical protein